MKDFTWQHLDTEHHVNLRYFYSANMAACLCLLGRLRLHSWWDFFLSVIKYRGIQSAKCLPALLYHNWNNEFCYMKPSTIISQNYCKSLSMRHGFKNGNPLNFSLCFWPIYISFPHSIFLCRHSCGHRWCEESWGSREWQVCKCIYLFISYFKWAFMFPEALWTVYNSQNE